MIAMNDDHGVISLLEVELFLNVIGINPVNYQNHWGLFEFQK